MRKEVVIGNALEESCDSQCIADRGTVCCQRSVLRFVRSRIIQDCPDDSMVVQCPMAEWLGMLGICCLGMRMHGVGRCPAGC